MKNFLFFLFLLPVWCFAQTPVTPQFQRKIPTDSLLGAKTPQGLLQLPDTAWVKKRGGKDLVAKATDFEGAGTTSSKLGLRDTLLKSNWIIKSTSTSLPGLTIDAENSDLTTPTITVFKFNGNRVSAIGSAGGYFGRGVFANSGGDYASVFTDTTGTLISRKKADSNPVLRLINLSSGSTGDFLFAGDSTSTKFRITRQGGIIAPLLTDTTGLTKSIVWNPSTGKFYTQTGGGGGNTIYTHDDSLRNGDRLVQQNQHNLEFDSYDPVNNLSGATILQPAYQNMTVNDSIGGAAQIGATTRLGNNQSQAFISVNTPGGGTDKLIQMNSKPNGYSLDTKGIYFREHIDSVGLLYQDTVSFKYGKRYNTWIPNWGSVKSRIDSAITAHSGSGTVTSITPGVGFLSHTPITTSGTMNVDTASTIVTKTFAGRYVTNSSTTAFTNKSGNISQWTNDSGYITSATVPVAANPTASVGGSPVNGSATTFMRSDAAPKADTSVLQTVLNLFPKTDTRYKHDFTIAGHSIASNSNTTLATLSYGYGIALQSGTSTYDASGGSTFRVDTGATIQTVANFFPKGDTRYARTGSTGTVTSIATSTGITGGTITSTGTLKADTSVLQTVNNFHPLGNTFWVPTSRTVAGFALSSNVTLAALTATDATLTFSGSYTGATARTVGLNLGNANTWTAAQTVSLAGITTSITTDGILVTNPTLATSSVTQQNPPVIRLTGHAWNATATAADNQGDYIMGVNMDRSNPSFPDPQWFLSARLSAAGSGAYTRFLTYDFYNGLTVTQALSVTGGVSTGNGITNSSGTIRSANFSAASAGNTMFIGNGNNFSSSGTGMDLGGSTITNSSGTYSSVIIHPTYNQTSTAAATDLTINRVQTAVGSGAQLFVDFQVGGSSKFKIDNTGQTTLSAPIILKGYTVSTLPTGVTGMTAYVTDALTPASLATVVGGGASVVPVFYNGTNWIVQ